MNDRRAVSRIVEILRAGSRFLLATHKEPDVDGISSMLALGLALEAAGKRPQMVTEYPVPPPLDRLEGAEKILVVERMGHADATLVLDCGDLKRLGGLGPRLQGTRPLINIDHHATNTRFGDVNFVEPDRSSTGEMVFEIIREAQLPLGPAVAENIFAAIQGDTGSFQYDNTSSRALRVAAEMVERGAVPWDVSRRMMNRYPRARLELLRKALETLEFHCRRSVGIMTLTSEMFSRAGAIRTDSERFVDYPRFVEGVEVAVLIRQTAEDGYKFSLRSNGMVDVAQLAVSFGGGGHARAAGFEVHGDLETAKAAFLEEARRVLDEKFASRYTAGGQG